MMNDEPSYYVRMVDGVYANCTKGDPGAMRVTHPVEPGKPSETRSPTFDETLAWASRRHAAMWSVEGQIAMADAFHESRMHSAVRALAEADDKPDPTERACGCGAHLPDTALVRRALALWDEVNHYGNLHVYVEDGNLEDGWIFRDADDRPFPEFSTARESVLANDVGDDKATPAELTLELALVAILEEMTEEERYSAYGTCWACRVEHWKRHGMWVDDDESTTP